MSSPSAQRTTGKTALVTGAASGIGRAIAQHLAAEGARVVVADLNLPEAERVAQEISSKCGGHAIPLHLDVISEPAWEAALARVLAEWGHLNILVNCAGIAFAKPITELTLADWRKVLSINLDGVFLGTQHALRAMSDSGGCIINIASAAGIKPISGNAAYGTSKAAIRFFTKVAALEGKPHNIRVNSISPGAVATPMWESTDLWPREVATALGREVALRELVARQDFAQPEEIAAAVMFLAGEEAGHITGADLVVDAGFSIG